MRKCGFVCGGALGVVLAAGQACGQVYSWSAAVDGNWSASAMWSPAGVPDMAGESAVLGLSGPYTVTVDVDPVIDALTLTNVEAVAAIRGGRTLTVGAGGIANDGVIVINSNASSLNAALSMADGGVIGGSGEIVLSRVSADRRDAQLVSGAGMVVTHSAGHRISGSGVLEGEFANSGEIVATDPLQALELEGTFTQGGTGVVRADGAMLLLRNAVVDGGTVEGVSGGMVLAQELGSVLTGVTAQGELGVGAASAMTLNVLLENQGVLRVNPDGSALNATLSVASDTEILGAGEIVLWRASSDASDAAFVTETSATATLGANQFVHGSGRMSGEFVNRGEITADDVLQPLELDGVVSQTGSGVIGADGATMLLRVVEVSGGTFATQNLGIVDVAFGDTATVRGVTNSGELGVRGAGTLAIGAGGLVNNDTVYVNTLGDSFNATMRFDVTSSVEGVGQIVMTQASSDLADARVRTEPGAVGTFGAGQVVTGTGHLDGDFVLAGQVVSGATGAIRLDGSVGMVGAGLLRGDMGRIALGTVAIDGGVVDGINGGSTEVAFGGVATLSGTTNIGEFGVLGAGTLEVDAGGLVNNGVVRINSASDSFNATMRFVADAAVTGVGGVVLNQTTSDTSDAVMVVDPGFTATFGGSQVISGRGRMDGTFVVDGAIVADVAATDLVVLGEVDLTSGGEMRGDGGAVALGDVSVVGGTFAGENGGRVDVGFGGVATVDGVVMNGGVGVRGAGTMALAGDITNNGELTVNSLSDSFNATLRGDADVTVGGSGSIVLNQVTSDAADASIDGNGFTVTIAGTQSLLGRGRISGDVVAEGLVAPGLPVGDIAVPGRFVLASSAMLAVDLGSTSSFDRLVGTGEVALDGALEVAFVDGYSPLFGDSFAVVDGPTVTGEFASVDGSVLPGDLVYKVRYEARKAVLVITCPADTNIDGQVNTQDFLVFLNLWTSGDPEADWNGDGVVNTLDFLAYLNGWSAGC